MLSSRYSSILGRMLKGVERPIMQNKVSRK
jgi:hypothetical protein